MKGVIKRMIKDLKMVWMRVINMVECPYCGKRMAMYDIDEVMEGISGEMDCMHCGGKLKVKVRMEIAYDVFPKDGE